MGEDIWRGSDRAARDDARRRRLLASALQLFGTDGFRATTVQGLCRHAEVSSRSFYELFSSREDLFSALYDALNAEVLAGIPAPAQGWCVPAPSDGASVPARAGSASSKERETGALVGAMSDGGVGDADDGAADRAVGEERLGAVVRGVVAAALAPMLADERKCRVLELEAIGVSEGLERRRRETYRQLAGAIMGTLAELFRAGMIGRPVDGAVGIILVGGVTEALAQRLQEPPERRAAPEDFLDDVTRAVVRLIG